MALDEYVKEVIVEVLCDLALADHLSDVRHAERGLWDLLGIRHPIYDHDSAWQNTKATLTRAGIALPDYLSED